MNESDNKAVPPNWALANLSSIGDIISGFAFESPEFINDGVPVIKISNISYGEFLWKQQQYLPQEYAKTYSHFQVQPNNILIALTRPITNNKLKVCIYPKGAPVGLLNQRVAVIKPYDNFSVPFILHYMRSEHFRGQIQESLSETCQPNLSPKILKEIKIPIAPVAEQLRIVAKIEELFSRLDAGVENLKQINKLVRRYRDSLLHEAINGRLTEQWRKERGAARQPLPDLPGQRNIKTNNGICETNRLSENEISISRHLPSEWTFASLGDIGKVKGRIGWRGYKKTDLTDAGAYVIGATHLTPQGKLDLSNPVFISDEKYDESPEIQVDKGDLMIVQRGSIGKVARLDFDLKKATINPSLILIKDFRGSGQYLLYVLLSPTYQTLLKAGNTSTTIPMLTQKFIKNIMVPLPPLDEQMEIARQIQRRFSEADQIDNIAEHNALLASRVKKSILHAAFLGRLVPQKEGDGAAVVLSNV